jgi:hypothetical protein
MHIPTKLNISLVAEYPNGTRTETQKYSREVLILVHRKFLYVKDSGRSDKNTPEIPLKQFRSHHELRSGFTGRHAKAAMFLRQKIWNTYINDSSEVLRELSSSDRPLMTPLPQEAAKYHAKDSIILIQKTEEYCSNRLSRSTVTCISD